MFVNGNRSVGLGCCVQAEGRDELRCVVRGVAHCGSNDEEKKRTCRRIILLFFCWIWFAFEMRNCVNCEARETGVVFDGISGLESNNSGGTLWFCVDGSGLKYGCTRLAC